ncbi:hypothetical protein POM88_005211 [Heracleum sosnowskyi]|uniref:SWIM-type domain-containing protein n=1 Tax=Heracleum sosnowskyi TaxID=360622 RepID=A0AAD8JL48_9APIA|nr:hypothetical protein POM88_005211 [Heracleum sosnowskyi]
MSRKCDATWDGAKKFDVKHGTYTVTVDLVNRTCDCRVFQLTGIPCPYVVSAIHSSRQQSTAFVSDYSQLGHEVQWFDGRRIMHCSLCGEAGHRKNKCPNPNSEAKDDNNKTGKTVEKEGHQGERSNNKPKRPYKPKRKANVSWRNKNNEQNEVIEEYIVYEADQSEVDDEQEHVPTQRRPKLTVRRRLPVSLQED